MFPSYLPVKAPDPGAYHFNFLGHNQKCLTAFGCTLSFILFRKSGLLHHQVPAEYNHVHLIPGLPRRSKC